MSVKFLLVIFAFYFVVQVVLFEFIQTEQQPYANYLWGWWGRAREGRICVVNNLIAQVKLGVQKYNFT